MKLLLDQDVYDVTYHFLVDLKYDVVRAKSVGLERASDENILLWSTSHHRILITRDKDFGALVFLKKLGSGVIFLRMLPSNLPEVHKELLRVLSTYSEDELRTAFIVVEKDRHRFRKIISEN